MKRELIKRCHVGTVCLLWLLSVVPAYAQHYPNYLGGHLIYAMPQMDQSDFQDDIAGSPTVDFSNILGFQLRGGTELNEYLFLDALIDYIPFDNSHAGRQDTLDVINAGVNLKAVLFFLGRVEPYLAGGLGLMYAMNTASFETTEIEEDKLGFSGRLGLGVETVVGSRVAFGLEGAYTLGMGDTDDVSYFGIMLGVNYRF